MVEESSPSKRRRGRSVSDGDASFDEHASADDAFASRWHVHGCFVHEGLLAEDSSAPQVLRRLTAAQDSHFGGAMGGRWVEDKMVSAIVVLLWEGKEVVVEWDLTFNLALLEGWRQ